MKKCSYCAEEIQDEAIKCKHCGEMLHKAVQNNQEKGWFAKRMNPQIKCTNCEYIGKPGKIGWDAGSVLITLILLICFIVPGIVYALWRDGKANKVCCPKCKYLFVEKL